MDIDLTHIADSKCTQKIKLIFRGIIIAEIAIHPPQLKKIDTAFVPEEVWINDILHNNLVKDGCVRLV